MNIFAGVENCRIIDISQPVSSMTACFPGDTPFKRQITLSYDESKVINLTAITMSPHVGTHTDAPCHIQGDLANNDETAGRMPLQPFLGPCQVIDLAPCDGEISMDMVCQKIESLDHVAPRILFKTIKKIDYHKFAQRYAYFAVDLIEYLGSKSAILLGIDSQSVDHIDSKNLAAHHALVDHKMVSLENLDLSAAEEGSYFLIALPLKLMEAEASPVRAVLLSPG